MGKNKSGKGGGGGGGGGGKPKKGETSKKKCTCDHPYQCSCGNRPDRPSRGHKWDPEKGEWGGKGHKQKGASGQTASVAQADKVTPVGNIVLKQWQKLPTRLLGDLCKKNGKALGRGMPIYRPVGGRGGGTSGQHRFRVIIPDASKKGSEHDIVLTPSLSVSNEEQAREEAALLGLIYLFPKLPHERTLPEPYRSTYLAALKNSAGGSSSNVNGGNAKATQDERNVGAAKGGAKSKESNGANATSSKKDDGNSTAKPGGGAVANTALAASLPSFHLKKKNNNDNGKGAPGQQPLLTKAQVNEARKQHKREVQARIRKHEAIRNANKPMEVFMSARFRRRIECLLSGGVFEDDDEDLSLDPAEEDGGDDDDVIRSYVHQRLIHEGFASSHVLRAYREAEAKGGFGRARGEDEQMNAAYEETLQYLCIHLREDQLPIGFDPRGGTLDILRPTTIVKSERGGKVAGGRASDDRQKGVAVETGCDEETLRFAECFGLTPAEALAIRSANEASFSSPSMELEELSWKQAFWEVLANVTSLPIERTCFNNDATGSLSDDDRGRNEEAASNEREALEAIFEPGQVSIRTQEGGPFTSVTVALQFNGGPDLSMEVLYVNGAYPDLLPAVFLTTRKRKGVGAGQRAYRCGGRIHLELARYLSEMVLGQEVIFELYGHLQSLLQEEEANSSPSSIDVISELLSRLNAGNGDRSDAPIVPTESTSSEPPKTSDQEKRRQEATKPSARRPPKPRSRPRQGSTFWNTRPNKIPPAEAHPKPSMALARARGSLPAARARKEFLSLMAGAKSADGRVVLVTGETGCGKTTQIPQFILENSPNEAKIVVAQPRRLAATGVACRVALERGETAPGGASVGYVVRGDSKMCPSTRLMFCTTGVLLRQLQSENALENITHIVVDEVHERHLDTDVLLAILKNALPSLPNLSVVLMSATMDADRFAKYWGNFTPRMHIPGFTHPVRDFTLEDVLEMTSYIPPKKKKKKPQYGGRNYQAHPRDDVGDDDEHLSEGYSQLSPATCAVPLEERLRRMNESEIDYDLVALLVRTLLRGKEDDGSILIFLPGAGEIDRAERAIQQIVRGHSIAILPLHGGLQPEKQQRVFVPARKGFTKVILSTNVAETSITIPDCTIVVDTCKEKQSSFDPVNRMPLLLERFASQDSLKQRRGRAGRVRPGTCYKLISKSLHNKLPEHGEPEIRRCALDQTILSLLFLGLEDGTGDFLRLLLDPPSQQSIDAAMYSLEKTGALYKAENRGFLTPLGTHLAGIPAPPPVGKLLVMGTLLGCRDMAVAIAAGMSAGRSPFLRMNSFPNNRKQPPKDDRVEQEKEIANDRILAERAALFTMVGKSDHAMLGKAFLLWKECQGQGARKKFCDKLGLAFNSMRDILALVRQLDSSLTTSGFVPSKECNRNGSSWRIVRSMIVASLSPTQVVRVQRPSAKYTETVEGSIEKEGKAKELKFFIRGGVDSSGSKVYDDHKDGTKKEERVFIHPSSSNFTVGSYSCPWLVYHRMVRTSKAFVSDATECNPYSLLLFGGAMEVQASKGMIVLDDWIRLSANARIGSLIGGVREKVDELLEQKVSNPSLDITGSAEMKLITDLLRHDGV